MKEKDFCFSIDKLCVVGRFKNEGYYNLLHYFSNNPLFKEKIIDNQFFNKSFLIEDNKLSLGFIQLDRITNKFRFEYNPNHYIDYPEYFYIIKNILEFTCDYHFTRIDLAIDLFNYKIVDYNIVDVMPRKKAYFYGLNNCLETCYFGSMSSNKFVRIYNKAKEQKLDRMEIPYILNKNTGEIIESTKDWWRIELQLRDTFISDYLSGQYDFLEGIYIFKYVSLDKYDVQTKAVLEYLLFDITRFRELSKNVKTRYRKILHQLKSEKISFVNTVMQCANEYVLTYLKIFDDDIYYILN